MLQIGSSSNRSTDSTLGHEINVLLVDHDKEWLASTADLLQMCSYKVTKVETALDALSILSDGMHEFDLVLVDINLHDLDAFTLLKLISKMDLLSILMSENDDDGIISKAMKSGAFLFVSRPFSIDVMKQMRQHVIRERMKRLNKHDEETNLLGDEDINGASENYELKRNVGITISEDGRVGKKRKAKNGQAKKGRMGKKSNKDQEGNSVSENHKFRNCRFKRKACTEWTQELHEKFMDAVNQLGEGGCYPKEILDIMNVPGLTRMQVASHLQKCRNDNWRAPVVRKYRQVSSGGHSNGGAQRRDSQRRFGSMPRVEQSEPSVQENIYTPEITSSPASEFTENGPQQDQQNRTIRNRIGSYPFMTQERESSSFEDSGQTMDNTDSELEANYNANGTIYIPTMENMSELQSYDPVYSGPSGVIPGVEYHSIPVGQKQPNDDFFDFLRNNMDDYVPNLSRVLQDGSVGNQGSSSQPFLYNYSQQLLDQATMTTPDSRGQWSASTSNFFRY